MTYIPYLLVAICLGVPLCIVGKVVYEQWLIGRELDEYDEDSNEEK